MIRLPLLFTNGDAMPGRQVYDREAHTVPAENRLPVVGDIGEIEIRAEIEQTVENALFLAERVARQITVKSTDTGIRAEGVQLLAVIAQVRNLRRALHAELAG